MSIKKNINRWINRNFYNIGFITITPDEFITKKDLPKIHWVKHPYKDRFFADPFILDVTPDTIYCLVEECIFGNKGTIALLEVDRNTYRLKERKPLLNLDTHLSYPAVMYHDEKTYVYPENGQSGSITMYNYDKTNQQLVKHSVLASDDLIDSSIVRVGDVYYLLATTIKDGSLEAGYLYKSMSFYGPFKRVYDEPVTRGLASSRPGGNFFTVNGIWYRPAQDCRGGYGKALNIMRINSFEPFVENCIFRLGPQSFRYNLGLHTLNFHKSGIAVVDSRGYVHPVLGRILCPIYDILQHVK